MSERTALLELADRLAKDHPESTRGELPASWTALMELGLVLVGTPEVRGGAGGSFVDVATVVDGLARHGIGGPLATASLANWAASLGGIPCEPDALWTVACTDDVRVADGRMNGTLSAVPWARHAQGLVVAGAHQSWFVDLREPGVAITEFEDIAGDPRDGVDLFAAPVSPLAGAPARAQVEVRQALLATHALHGALEGAYQLTRTYVATREQFGKPLVKIPAVATKLALIRTALLELEAAMSRADSLYDAAPDSFETSAAVVAARVLAGRAAGMAARTAHQLHGAMGVTLEYPLHHLTTRLWAWRDGERATAEWSRQLGQLVLDVEELELWDELTGHAPLSPNVRS